MNITTVKKMEQIAVIVMVTKQVQKNNVIIQQKEYQVVVQTIMEKW